MKERQRAEPSQALRPDWLLPTGEMKRGQKLPERKWGKRDEEMKYQKILTETRES